MTSQCVFVRVFPSVVNMRCLTNTTSNYRNTQTTAHTTTNTHMKNNKHLTTRTKNINKYKTQRNTKHARNGNDKHQLIQNTHKYNTQTNNNHKRQQQHKQQLHKSTGPCFCLYLWSHSPASEHMSHESQLNHEVFTAVAESYSRCNRPRATPDPQHHASRQHDNVCRERECLKITA